MRRDVLAGLATTQGYTKTSLNALATADTDNLDVAVGALTDCRADLVEIRSTAETIEAKLNDAVNQLAQLGSRSETITTMLQETIDELTTALSNADEAARATQEAADTIRKMLNDRGPLSKVGATDSMLIPLVRALICFLLRKLSEVIRAAMILLLVSTAERLRTSAASALNLMKAER